MKSATFGVLAVVFIAGFWSARAMGVSEDGFSFGDEPSDVSEIQTTVGFIENSQCNPVPVGIKFEKMYEATGNCWKRKGVLQVATTLYNAHTREALPVFENLPLDEGQLQHFLRCRGFAKEIQIDRKLLDIMIEAALHFEAKRTTIISGYRSKKFNETLAKKGRRVAVESRHTEGQAIDFSLDSVDAATLGAWLKKNHEGGVGIYVEDNFVHIDSGAPRSWRGY